MADSNPHWIVSDPGILGGKPCVRGTRISVEHLLELLATGATRESINKELRTLREKGLVSTTDKAICIHDIKRLRSRVR